MTSANTLPPNPPVVNPVVGVNSDVATSVKAPSIVLAPGVNYPPPLARPPEPLAASAGGGPGKASFPLGISAHISPRSGVVFYPKGIQTIARKQVMGQPAGARGDRGKVTGFSAHSRGRLRRVLMSWTPPDGWILGAGSFTLPGPVVEGDVWRKAFNSWKLFVAKIGACAIWRIELQTRKQPHAHVTVWGPTKEIIEKIFWYWPDCVRSLGPIKGDGLRVLGSDGRVYEASSVSHRMGLLGASDHALSWSWSRDDMAGWWRYLCDHSSKKKEAQLGWQGRQWGVIGRVHFKKLRGIPVWLSDAEFSRVLRFLRRLSRPADPSKRKYWRNGKLRGKRGCSDWFSRPDVMRRAVEWAKSETVK